MEYQIGDKVRIREDLKAFYVYDDMAFSPFIHGEEVTDDEQ